MDKQNIDLEAFAKQVAEDTAAKIAMKQAEQKAAEEAQAKAAQEAEEAKALEAQSIKTVVNSGVAEGVEKLMADVEAKLNEKEANIQEVVKTFEKDLQEKNAEIEAMRNSKRQFSDRADGNNISKWGQDFMTAKMIGTITGKGYNTRFAQDLAEKAGVDYTTEASGIDTEVSNLIEKEIQNELRVANLFREIPVNGKTTVLPVQMDGNVNGATWNSNTDTAGNFHGTNSASAGEGYKVSKATMTADRLISTTFLDNDIDEDVLINIMPMLVEGVARSHGKAVEYAILNGNGGDISGLKGLSASAGTVANTLSSAAATTTAAATDLLDARRSMGRYGLNPSDITYIVSQDIYYDLLKDGDFQTIDEVGSDLAVRVTGTVGAVFGSPVVVSENFETAGANVAGAYAVYNKGFVIPRLRGVSVEQDYEVLQQRRVLVASQNLGFTRVQPVDANNIVAARLEYSGA